MKSFLRVSSSLGSALFCAAMAGCASDSTSAPTGDLIATWGGSLCVDGVHQLSLSLSGPSAQDTSSFCSDQEHRFTGLDAGSYDLTVEFLGDGGPLPLVGDGQPTSLTISVIVQTGRVSTKYLDAQIAATTPDGGVDTDGPPPPPPPPPPTDDDMDGVPDEYDNCVGVFNPDQLNTDQDAPAHGDACDCAPNDRDLAATVLDDPLDTDSGQLTAVDGTWGYFGGVYRQTEVDGLARSWRPGDDLDVVSVDTEVRLTGSGSAGTMPPMAGIVLRAGGFAAGPAAGQAYVCATDGGSLLIGLLDAGAGSGLVTVLANQILPFSLTVAAPLHAGADGTRLSCSLTNPADPTESVAIRAVDAALSSGSTGFVTNGMSADFTFARICAR
jgi:hypothetical protein